MPGDSIQGSAGSDTVVEQFSGLMKPMRLLSCFALIRVVAAYLRQK